MKVPYEVVLRDIWVNGLCLEVTARVCVCGNKFFILGMEAYVVEAFHATWLISSFLHYLGQMPSENSLPALRCIAASVSLCVTSLGCYGYRCEVTRSPVELEIGEN